MEATKESARLAVEPLGVGGPEERAGGPTGARPAGQVRSWLRGDWVWRRAGEPTQWAKGLVAAVLSPFFLGLAPVFAKQAYRQGAAPDTVIAMRMTLAAGVLWLVYLLFARQFIRSWWLGIAASAVAGTINGLGSICYYHGLARIDTSLASLLNISYLVFVTLLLRGMGQSISRVTLLRLGLAIGAVCLLAQASGAEVDLVGVSLLLAGAFAYALQLVIGQRILYDIPAPTMTLYSVSAMAVVVNLAWMVTGGPEFASLTSAGWRALLAFAGVTAVSRLTLFLGVKHLGSVQTAALGVLEALVTVLLAMLFFGETMVAAQWVGGGLMILSVMLLGAEKGVPRPGAIPLVPLVIRLSGVLERLRGGRRRRR